MTTSESPTFRTLTRAECEAVLSNNHVGRIAYAFHNRVDIEPIHYVFADGYIYGRTAPGTKLSTLAHQPWIAFEVDEVHDLFHWRSVVVRGTVYRVEPHADAHANEPYARAVDALRRLMPNALSDRDPVPERSIVFRIFTDDMTGRAAEPR